MNTRKEIKTARDFLEEKFGDFNQNHPLSHLGYSKGLEPDISDIITAMEEYHSQFKNQGTGIKWVKASENPKESGMYIWRNEGAAGQAYFDIDDSPINEFWKSRNMTEWLDECNVEEKQINYCQTICEKHEPTQVTYTDSEGKLIATLQCKNCGCFYEFKNNVDASENKLYNKSKVFKKTKLMNNIKEGVINQEGIIIECDECGKKVRLPILFCEEPKCYLRKEGVEKEEDEQP